MSQSFVQIYIHIVFHTKDNAKLIRVDIENELFSYLCGILKNHKSIPLQIGGTSDHIHILCTLPKTIALADLVEEIKKSSSKWIKTKGAHYNKFYWQDGYGGFSVSNSGVDRVKTYILNQKKHHEKVTFTDEYKNLLEAYGIPYEDRYL
jgi:putative transposase